MLRKFDIYCAADVTQIPLSTLSEILEIKTRIKSKK